ncbi:MAG: metallophosphoesterase, partial [Holophaga sp.]|nr:metallophosphoesterase [Holophaga sp.]
MSDDQTRNKSTNSLERREFIKRAAVGAGAVAMGMVAMGCSSSSGGGGAAASGGQLGTQATLPTTSAWKFAVMGDTQWIAPDDGLNPNTAAIGLIAPLNSLFIAEKVKFVVQVGDLADSGNGAYPNEANYGYSTPPNLCEDTRAIFTQSLYNNGIGFFPLRGNHDDLNTTATEFVKLYPQTQNGTMNVASAYALETSTIGAVTNGYPDAAGQPLPTASGSTFT